MNSMAQSLTPNRREAKYSLELYSHPETIRFKDNEHKVFVNVEPLQADVSTECGDLTSVFNKAMATPFLFILLYPGIKRYLVSYIRTQEYYESLKEAYSSALLEIYLERIPEAMMAYLGLLKPGRDSDSVGVTPHYYPTIDQRPRLAKQFGPCALLKPAYMVRGRSVGLFYETLLSILPLAVEYAAWEFAAKAIHQPSVGSIELRKHGARSLSDIFEELFEDDDDAYLDEPEDEYSWLLSSYTDSESDRRSEPYRILFLPGEEAASAPAYGTDDPELGAVPVLSCIPDGGKHTGVWGANVSAPTPEGNAPLGLYVPNGSVSANDLGLRNYSQDLVLRWLDGLSSDH